MKLIIDPQVFEDLEDSYKHYEPDTNTGDLFLADFNLTLDRVEENPRIYQIINATDYRRCNFLTFPHCVFFKMMTDHVYIIALAHQHQKPRF